MTVTNPLQSVHEEAGATFLRYGSEGVGAEVVETFGFLEQEYAATRKGAGVLDMPHRGTIEITGGDRIEFLNRMVTQELKGLEPFGVRRSFWLNRKGRIDADLRMIALPDRVILDTEVLSVSRTIESLSAYLFAEDVRIEDVTPRMHRLAVHGPRAAGLLSSAALHQSGAPIGTMRPDEAGLHSIDGASVLVDRHDSAGVAGFELLVAAEDAERVYATILGAEDGAARRIGWHAYNIARIEAGTPIFGVDYGPTNLPHETGREVLLDRVSFRKGCYLGQEIVARMQSLGHPKQVLVALRVDESDSGAPTDQPATGSAVSQGDKVVGAVTSCTRGPMLGDSIIALAQVKWDAAKPGGELRVDFAGGGAGRAVVQEHLTFWSHGAGAGVRKD